MTHEDVLLAAIAADPADGLAWLALADWLEEDGQTPRAELLRLTRRLRDVPFDAPERREVEARVTGLLSDNVRPANPEVVNSVGMRFRLIPPGRFVMGSYTSADEQPPHEVTITRPFWLGVTPVTQSQYEAVTGTNPSHFRVAGEGWERVEGMSTADFPVEMVSWADATEFCRRLSASGPRHRLPTEAEWEYACRGGTTSNFHLGDTLSWSQANFDNQSERTCAVASYPPNAFGLHDLHGTVGEWCDDWFHPRYPAGPRLDPTGPSNGRHRVVRGGGWSFSAAYCRTANRDSEEPGRSHNDIGLRVVRE